MESYGTLPAWGAWRHSSPQSSEAHRLRPRTIDTSPSLIFPPVTTNPSHPSISPSTDQRPRPLALTLAPGGERDLSPCATSVGSSASASLWASRGFGSGSGGCEHLFFWRYGGGGGSERARRCFFDGGGGGGGRARGRGVDRSLRGAWWWWWLLLMLFGLIWLVVV